MLSVIICHGWEETHEMLAAKIRRAGGSVDQKTYDRFTHEFFGMGAVHSKAKDAEARAADALKMAFGK